MANTPIVIEQYMNAFHAELYKVQLKNRLTNEGFWVNYSPEQLTKAVGYLRKRNRDGFDVYCRPVGYQYVLLDDLTRETLTALATLQPCMLVETSFGNYQAWLILADVPADRETAKAICKELAQRFGADPASAEPDHVGRLPGFTNRKLKYQLANGLYPFVQLRKAQYRVSSFHPCGGAVPTLTTGQNSRTPLHQSCNGSLSEQDFGQACWLIRQGKSDADICDYLMRNSPNLLERKGQRYVDSYLRRTINNAHKSIGQSHRVNH